ncbi:MAG TPA: glycosyltransferase [Lachnospiraceae bacterium]|nr:glycosyltransferase [Lachnospiraceae bacterium]
MKVDAVIPAYKPGHDLRELVEKLLDQTVRLGRIIIINTDREYFDEKEYLIAPAVEVVHITRHEFDHAGTRDMGLRMSDADYVLFMTMDAIPKDNYLVEKLLSGFRRADNIAVSYARQLPKKDCNRIEQITREFNYPAQSRVQTSDDIKELGIKAYFCSDVCAMYDTSIYRSLGGFKAPAIFNEDMVYAAGALDAGYAVSYCADALVYHSHNYTGRQYYRRNFDLGVSQADHPEIFERFNVKGTGMQLVRKSLAQICRSGTPADIIRLVYYSGMKYLGFRKGKNYHKLSLKSCLKHTSDKEYWNRLT